MADDLLDAVLAQLANFAVGFVERVEGAGSKVKGSGVLVSIEGRRGILTCGHVAETYDKLPEIGLVRFIAGTQQRRIVKFEGAKHLILESSSEWSEKRLWGITSWQMDKQNNTGAVAGQGWDRIEQGLIPTIREKL